MKSFTYTMQTSCPMMFGSAGCLAEAARCYPDTTATMEMGTRCADIANPLKVMTMGIRKGDRVTVSVDGPSEMELADVLYSYFDGAM